MKKPIGAGSAAALTFDVLSGGEPDFASLPFNPTSGRVQGGFITLRVVAGATEIGTWDILFQNTVGGQAHAAGPAGASECDGVGMDDLLAWRKRLGEVPSPRRLPGHFLADSV